MLSSAENKIFAWKFLVDLVFNEKIKIPVEFISEFRKLAEIHKLDFYTDHLRGKTLPEALLNNTWEQEFLKRLSDILPKELQILVLKGACARDMNLYPLPALRKSADLDLFVSGLNNFKEKEKIINILIEKFKLISVDNWQLRLKKLGNVVFQYGEEHIDFHFDLFSPMGNLCNVVCGDKEKNKKLEEQILEKAQSFRGLQNIKKLNYEDFWLYNIFHFLKDFPSPSLSLLLDSFLVLKNGYTNIEKIGERSKILKLEFLYKIGLYFISQTTNRTQAYEKSNLNILEKMIFNLNLLVFSNKLSIKSRLITSCIPGFLAGNGNQLLTFIYLPFYLIINNLIISDINEKFFSRNFLTNSIVKILYFFGRTKDYLRLLCLKLSGNISNESCKVEVIEGEKHLISIKLLDLKFTFLTPLEFYPDLKKIWKSFLTTEHLSDSINIDKVTFCNEPLTREVIYSNDILFLNHGGTVSLSSTGNFFAKNFWDVRNLALCLFNTSTFQRDDLFLVHAGSIKIKNGAIIFPGGSSAGKTTLFNLFTKHGFKGINDDTVLLKKEDGIWYVYPTPFMSNEKEPVFCERSKLIGILDPIKVCGGHEIKPVLAEHALALILNNIAGDIVIDDCGFTRSLITKKVLELTKQINYSAQIKYSLDKENVLIDLFNEYINNPGETYGHGQNLTRLIEVQGRSMEPTYKEGDILCVEEKFARDLNPKDVICFVNNSNSYPVVHRIKYLIKHKETITAITKGDNNITLDYPSAFETNKKLLRVTGTFSNLSSF